MMNIMGIVPARGGSKGVPGKNIRPLFGKPLLVWTAEAALASNLDRVLLSSDDAEIIECGRKNGLEIPFVRPLDFAQDDTPGIKVLLHAVTYLKSHEGYLPDAVMLLQPTSPLRNTRHINEVIELFKKTPDADAIVSVEKAPHNMIPESIMKISDDGLLKKYVDWDDQKNIRQLKPEYYARNGPAIYLARTEYLLKTEQLYSGKVVPYVMGRFESFDIDNLEDFSLCEFAIQTLMKDDKKKISK